MEDQLKMTVEFSWRPALIIDGITYAGGTLADIIRHMSDEDLKSFIYKVYNSGYKQAKKDAENQREVL